MPNVTIPALPPVILPLDGDTTLLEVSAIEAGEEVSRHVSINNLFGAFGLDATFVTVTANAALPNERILAGGLGIGIVDGGVGANITVNMPSGAADDLLFFSGGVWAATAGLLAWSSANRRLTIDSSVSTGAPHLSFPNITAGALMINMGPSGVDQTYTALRMSDGAGNVFDIQHDFSAAAALDGLFNILGASGTYFQIQQDGTIRFLNAFGTPVEIQSSPVDAFLVQNGATTFYEEIAAAQADRADHGQWWVRDDVPNTPMFTDDVGTDSILARGDIDETILGAWTFEDTVTISVDAAIDLQISSLGSPSLAFTQEGAPVDEGQWIFFAQTQQFNWASSTDGGVSTSFMEADRTLGVVDILTFTSAQVNVVGDLDVSGHITLPGVNEPLTPTLQIGSVGFFEISGNRLGLSIGTVSHYQWDATHFSGATSFSGAVSSAAASATVPGLTFLGDEDTGDGRAAANAANKIAGGVEAQRWSEAGGSILQAIEANVGLTADAGSSQGDGVITSSFNVYSVVANPGDAATLPALFTASDPSTVVYVKNDGANSMDVFPALGDDAGAGVNVAIAVAAGVSAIFIATVDNSTWTQLIAVAAAGGGDVFKVGIPVNNQIGVWTGDGTIEGDANFTFSGGAAGVLSTPNITGDATELSITGYDESDDGLVLEDGMRLTFEDRAFANDVFLSNEGVGGGSGTLTLRADSTANFILAAPGLQFNNAALTEPIGLSLLTTTLRRLNISQSVRTQNAIYFVERAAANADFAGDGQFWVRNDTPNTPMFTDDAGTDFELNATGAGTDNDAVQARRTTTLTLTTAFVDVTLDATDVETDAAVIEHDNVNTDDIDIKVAGTYEIAYEFDIDSVTAVNSFIAAQGRVRLNNAGTGIVGSLATTNAFRQHGNNVPNHLSIKFVVTLAASDFVTLQAQKIDLGGAEAYVIENVTFQVTRLL